MVDLKEVVFLCEIIFLQFFSLFFLVSFCDVHFHSFFPFEAPTILYCGRQQISNPNVSSSSHLPNWNLSSIRPFVSNRCYLFSSNPWLLCRQMTLVVEYKCMYDEFTSSFVVIEMGDDNERLNLKESGKRKERTTTACIHSFIHSNGNTKHGIRCNLFEFGAFGEEPRVKWCQRHQQDPPVEER